MADEKKYRTEIPNIIDDLGLDPHERALYVHYKRACGGNDCEWVESIRITGQRTKMSFSRASMARKSLVNRGLIHLIPKGNDGTAVKIVNIWELNTVFYQQEDRPDIDGWTIERLTEWCQGVHNMNTINEESLKNEPETVGVHNMNGSVNNVNTSVHNMNNKKEPIEKEPEELLPNGNSGLQPQQSINQEEAESRENVEAAPAETLLPDTPESRLLFAKINRNRSAKERNQAKRFASLEQKQKCLDAAKRLGYKRFSEGIDTALANGIPADLKALVNWIAKFGTGRNGERINGHTKKTGSNQGTGPAGAPISATGLGEWTEDEKRLYGFS